MPSKKSVDLLLVNPSSRAQVYQALGESIAALEPPVWAGLLATFARHHGLSVQLLDAEAESLTHEAAADRIVQLNPLLVAVVVYGHQPSASTQVMPGAGALSRAIKQRDPQTKIVMVGGHVAALPERSLKEETIDFVSVGEGLYTLVDLVGALKGGRTEDLAKVRDLGFLDEGRVLVGPPAPLLKNLVEEMPELAWDLMPMDKYRAHNWHCFGDLERQPYAAVYTTLGCPYHCTFCCIQAPFKAGEKMIGIRETVNSYRFWTPQAVIAQIDRLVNQYGVRNIKIADEMFVLNQRHVDGICDLIIKRGYDLNIWAYARVDTIRGAATVEKLKRAGFNWLALGIESANERVRDNVEKGFSQDLVYKTVEAVRAGGINVIANYIFGLPEDDIHTMQETLDMSVELNCEFANFYSAMAYPGSQLYTVALKEGLRLPESWSGYSQHAKDTLPLPTKYLTGPEVLRFRDNAFQVYFSGSRYRDMVAQKFGPETAQHILEMTSLHLERQYA